MAGLSERRSADENKAPEVIYTVGTLVHKDNALTITGYIDGLVECRIVVDTGSTVTIVRPDIVKRCKGMLFSDTVRPTKSLLRTATGDSALMNGRCKLKINLGRTETLHDVLVADITDECILGLDFMLENNCSLDMVAGKFLIDTEEVIIIIIIIIIVPVHKPSLTPITSCRRVVMVQTVLIPPFSEAFVPAKVEMKPGEHGLCAIGPAKRYGGKTDVLVRNTLVELPQEEVLVRVINPTETPKKIKRGYQIAIRDPVESVLHPAVTRNEVEGTTDDQTPDHLTDLYERSTANLNESQKIMTKELLIEFQDVFSKGPHDLGRTNVVQHTINTGDASPSRQHPRRLPFSKREEALEAIQDMHQQGIIEPSASPWASLIVLVRKKDGTTRFCVDYRTY